MEWPTATAAFLLADASGQPPELGGQVGVAASGSGPGALGQHVGQPAVALGGLARATLAPGDVVARAAARPACQVPGGREHGHVDADLGDDDLGGALADSGDGDPAGHGPPRTGRSPRRCGRPGRRWRLPGAPGAQGPARPATPWCSPKRPRSAWRSWGSFLRSLPLANSARTWGSRSPATRAASIARPETPRTSAATETLLAAGVLQGLLDPLALGAMGLEGAACGSGQDPAAGRSPAAARSCREAAHTRSSSH